jgi:hypothetical protein
MQKICTLACVLGAPKRRTSMRFCFITSRVMEQVCMVVCVLGDPHYVHYIHHIHYTVPQKPPGESLAGESGCQVEVRSHGLWVGWQGSPHWGAFSVGFTPFIPLNPSHPMYSIRFRENSRSSWSVGPTGCGWNDRDPHIGGRFQLSGMAGVPTSVGVFSGSHSTQSIQSISFH